MVTMRPASLERAGRILDELVAAAMTAGVQLDVRQGSACWLVDGETVTFELVELADKVEHVATDKELAAHAKWKREREEYHRRYNYWRDWGEPKIPKWEDRYQGRLAIRLEEVRVRTERSWWGPAIRRQFADRSTCEVAKDIPRVVKRLPRWRWPSARIASWRNASASKPSSANGSGSKLSVVACSRKSAWSPLNSLWVSRWKRSALAGLWRCSRAAMRDRRRSRLCLPGRVSGGRASSSGYRPRHLSSG